MIAIHRPTAAQFRAVARKCVVGRPRGPAPPVILIQDSEGSRLVGNFGDVSLAVQQPLEGGRAARVAIPGSLLDEIESGQDGIARIEATGDLVRCTWDISGSPRESIWTRIEIPEGSASTPQTLKAVDRSILEALHECGRSTSRESVRFALSRLQIQGESGQIVGTDGRQLLVWNGVALPFGESVLVPAVPVFGCRELAAANDIRIGKTDRHVVLTAGPWTVWLSIDTSGRFPNVMSVMPRSTDYEMHLDEMDRQRAFEFCKQAVETDDEPALITVAFANPPALRARTGPAERSSELLLVKSRCEGDAVSLVFNRDHLQRALSLGLRHASAPSENGPVVFRDDKRTYVVTTFLPTRALPAHRPLATTPAVFPHIVPDSEGVSVMPSDTNGRNAVPPDSSPAESFDFMAEAEALRDALGEVARRAGRLVNSLKQLQKQRRVLETAWSSLKNLRLGS